MLLLYLHLTAYNKSIFLFNFPLLLTCRVYAFHSIRHYVRPSFPLYTPHSPKHATHFSHLLYYSSTHHTPSFPSQLLTSAFKYHCIWF